MLLAAVDVAGPARDRRAALNPSCLKASNVPPMPVRAHHIVTIVALALAGLALSGCGTINEKITPGVVDAIPQWAGGMPSDVPPRRGTPEYDAYMQERERKRLEPAPAKDDPAKANAQSLDPVH